MYNFSFLSYFSLKIVIFSSVVEFLENILALSRTRQDLVYSHQSLAEERFLDPWPWLEGSYKIGPVCSSFHLPVVFLGIGLLVFSETELNVRSLYIAVCGSRIFWKKYPSGKNGHKWPKNMTFGLFKKITSLFLFGICEKWKFLWFINILQKLHA